LHIDNCPPRSPLASGQGLAVAIPPTPEETRPPKAKSEKDCPFCVEEHSHPPHYPLPALPVVPYSEFKGKDGRPKSISTQWHFCPHPDCRYYLEPDERIHALIGYGSHGKHERIQDLFCQACQRKFTIRRNTILFRLHTLAKTVETVLHLSACGCDISVLAEVFQKQECTIRMWLTRGGHSGKKLHNHFLQNLHLFHVQLDELYAQVKRADQKVWVATDAVTKLIPVLKVGDRMFFTS
jgi:hypothetical protein